MLKQISGLGLLVAAASSCALDVDELDVDQVSQEAVTPCTVTLASTQNTVTLGQDINFTATPSCPSGTPVVRLLQKVNNQFIVVGAESTDPNFTFSTATSPVGPNVFKAEVKQQGSSDTRAASNLVTVQVNDNVPTCTNVKLTVPANNAVVTLGTGTALTATANCGAGSPEFQFWVKKTNVQNWTFLPGPYVQNGQSGLWLPVAGDIGQMHVRAAARSVGAHVQYSGLSATNTVTVQAPVNIPPVAGNVAITTDSNTVGTVDVTNSISDANNDPLLVSVATQPTNGSASANGNILSYTPNTNFTGTDSFTYQVDDGKGGLATASVSVTVDNQDPTANNDAISTSQGVAGSVDVILNDSDPESQTLSVVSFSQGTNGTVSFVGTVATYTPTGFTTGVDSFTYTIQDTDGAQATATVNVSISASSPGCTASLSAPPTAVFGVPFTLTATAQCNTGPAQIQFLHKVNNGFEIIQPFGAATTATFASSVVGLDQFRIQVRTLGTTAVQATSAPLTGVTVSDNNVSFCSNPKLTSPTNNAVLAIGTPVTLSATASCTNGGVPEFQYWIKSTAVSNWTILPGFSQGPTTFTPNGPAGSYHMVVVVRSANDSHANYQTKSQSIVVTQQ